MEDLYLCPPGYLQQPASDVDVDAIVVHHEMLGAILAHLVHLWPGRYPLIEDAVWLLEELFQHLQAVAWTLPRYLSSCYYRQLWAGPASLPVMTSNALRKLRTLRQWKGGLGRRAHLAHHAIGKWGSHSQNEVDEECRDEGQVRIQVGHCGRPRPMLPICMRRQAHQQGIASARLVLSTCWTTSACCTGCQSLPSSDLVRNCKVFNPSQSPNSSHSQAYWAVVSGEWKTPSSSTWQGVLATDETAPSQSMRTKRLTACQGVIALWARRPAQAIRGPLTRQSMLSLGGPTERQGFIPRCLHR